MKGAWVPCWVLDSILRTEGGFATWVPHHICVVKALGGLGQWDGSDRGPGVRKEGGCQYLGEHRHSIEEGRGGWGEGNTLEDHFGNLSNLRRDSKS